MIDRIWHWLAHSDAGLATRIAVGVTILAAMAAWDIRRRGRAAKRWREYLFLLTATAAAMIYGVLNDQITVTISWEYFHWGKGLHAVLGGASPPEMATLRWEAAKVGMKATWSAGLIVGIVVLFANNPRKSKPQLPYRKLYALILPLLLTAAAFGVAGGAAGYCGLFDGVWVSPGPVIVEADLWRPRRYLCVWGIHLGGYLGGAIGVAAAAWRVAAARTRVTAGPPPPDVPSR